MAAPDQFKSYDIDKTILLFFGFVILVSASVFGYRLYTYSPCDQVRFEAESHAFRVGEIIRFSDFADPSDKRIWDFGDQTERRYGAKPFHTYQKPGKYTVMLKLNGKCEFSKVLAIKKRKFIIDSSKLANFELPKSIQVGEVLTVRSKDKNASYWEWRFGESAIVNSTTKTARYIYKTPGIKTVTLVLDRNNQYRTQKRIRVLPIQEQEPDVPRGARPIANSKPRPSIKYAPTGATVAPEPVRTFRAPDISNEKFKQMLIDVSRKKAKASDFKTYLCQQLEIPMFAKGKRTTFIELCEKIKGKKIKIKALEISRDAKTNCIIYISMQYSRSGLF